MITIFVSSTFRDMNGERDIIQRKVVPAVNAKAEQYGESIWCKDLRWGIDTTDFAESAGNTRILNVCLDEIDRSKPPFIILLGERYGWIPDKNQIRAQADRKRMQLKSLEISVTALEIEYGVFCRKYTPIVYFREAVGSVPEEFQSEDKLHLEKLESLKARLRKLCGDEIHIYRVRFDGSGPNKEDLNEFAVRLSEDICRFMVPRWEDFSRLTPRQKELTIQHNYLSERVRQYARASEDEDVIFNTLIGSAGEKHRSILPYAGLYLYQNGEGTGKSMLFARIGQRLSEGRQNVVFAFTVGLTPASSSALELLKSEVYALENYVCADHLEEMDGEESHGENRVKEDINRGENPGKDQPDTEAYCRRMEGLIEYLTENGRKVFFLVDGADKLQPGKDRDRLVFLPGSGQKGVAMLLMARTGYVFPFGETIKPSAVTFREQQFALNGLLKYYGKEMAEPVRFAFVRKSKQGGLLYTSILLKRLLQMNANDFEEISRRGGSINAINAYQKELIMRSPETTSELGYQVLESIGQAINPQLVKEVCGLLTMSPFGLRESDLAAIMGDRFNSLDLAALLQSWGECFLITSDGRIMLQIESVACGCLDHLDNSLAESKKIFSHLCQLNERDDFRSRYLLYFAQQSFRLDDSAVLRYLQDHYSGGSREFFYQAAYALWRGRIFGEGEQIIGLIHYLRSMTEEDINYLPSFMCLERLFMAAAEYYRIDAAYERIILNYKEAAAALKGTVDKVDKALSDALEHSVNNCCRILADYYSDRGDPARADEYRKRYLDSLHDPFSKEEPDPFSVSMYLLTLTERLKTYTMEIMKSRDFSVLTESDPIRDKLLQLCRDNVVKTDFPMEAMQGLLALQGYASAAAGFRKSDFSVVGEVNDLARRHPEMKEDKQFQSLIACLYGEEAERLSRASKEEKIPEDRRKLSFSYNAAAQAILGELIRKEPTSEMCRMLVALKLNMARILEQEGTGPALKTALNELIDGGRAFNRLESLGEDSSDDAFIGFTLYNGMGMVASELGDRQFWNVMETAFDKALSYCHGIPNNYWNLMNVSEIFLNQAEMLEKTGQIKHLQMAELRLRVSMEIMKKLMEGDVLKQLPCEERIKMKKWGKDVIKAHKRVKKKLR